MATISQGNDRGHVTACVEAVASADGAWWFLRNYDFNGNKQRASLGVYPNEASARRAYNDGEVKWDAWS